MADGKQASDLAHTSWRFQAWLDHWPLNRNTLLDYFKHSDFYDTQCNNEVIIMQRNEGAGGLKTLTGVEYEVVQHVSKDPNYFLILKQYRESPESVRIMQVWLLVARAFADSGSQFSWCVPANVCC